MNAAETINQEEAMEARIEWATVQADLRAGVYGDWHEVRQVVIDRMIEEGHEEIGSSDINHVAYGMVCAGDLVERSAAELLGVVA